MMWQKSGITETVLRDLHQSLITARMTTEEMLPALSSSTISASIRWNAGAAQRLTPACVFERRPVGTPAHAAQAYVESKLQMLFRGQGICWATGIMRTMWWRNTLCRSRWPTAST